MSEKPSDTLTGTEIAVVGTAGRFPGCPDVSRFWEALRNGEECLSRIPDADLEAAGVDASVLRDPAYVKAGGQLEGVDLFDAPFFGCGPKDAGIMDPQHRHFLECCWTALEHAGHPPSRFPGSIGVFAGCGMNAYFMFNVLSNRQLVDSVGLFLLRHTGNDRDFLPTTVSYKLNLRGPSVAVQTACSTSLVAVHLACQSLLGGECDMALAGGVTILVPHGHGYLYRPNEILSPDGHCRAFDAAAAGTVISSGAGVVVLRRLSDALADGDTVHAVIRGSAVNNDGSGKVGYLAPSVDGHAKVVAEALALADLKGDDISYIEAHGTGTAVGDPIEIAALTQAFRETTGRKKFCRIGSVKTNVGHLDTAAGVAGLIKVVEALKYREIPPSLHYRSPNPSIDFENSPFVVNDVLTPWTSEGRPLRAGISSLGVGGTNAHAILEEAPAAVPSDPPDRWEILPLSAKTPGALEAVTDAVADHLRRRPEEHLGDVAHTLQVGREAFEFRRVAVCGDPKDAVGVLEGRESTRVHSGRAKSAAPSVVFMFPGGGVQYPGMGRGLAERPGPFREELDRCLRLFESRLDFDLRALLFPDAGREEEAGRALEAPDASVCAVFAVEYALAKLWMSWGVRPAAMTGHSLGEYTAACLAEVFSLEDAVDLVALRGKLLRSTEGGAMLSIPLPEEEVRGLLGDDLDLAAVNGPAFCVVSGRGERLKELEARLAERELECRRLPLSAASHTRLLEPVLGEFRSHLKGVSFGPPRIPYVSNVTGTWVRPEDARDPDYWVRHFRHTVRFSQGLGELLRDPHRVLLEVGPGQTLGSLARQQPVKPAAVVSSMRRADEAVPDGRHLLTAFGRLWTAGVDVPWSSLRGTKRRRRVPLPTYPFEGRRYWIEPEATPAGAPAPAPPAELRRLERREDWFSRPVWRRSELPSARTEGAADARPTLVFLDEAGLGARLAQRLRGRGVPVVTVREGDAFYRFGDDDYALSPEGGRDGYAKLLQDLAARGKLPGRIAHFWLVTSGVTYRPGSNFFHRNLERGFYSLFFLAQSLGDHEFKEPLEVTVVSNGMQRVKEEPLPWPEKALVLGPVQVMPREFHGVGCRSVDVVLEEESGEDPEALTDRLLREIESPLDSGVVAWRGDERWVQAYERATPLPRSEEGTRAADRGVYLITGGLGGIGLAVAEHLAKTVRARLVLVGRSRFPDRKDWEAREAERGGNDSVGRVIGRIREMESEGAEVLVAAADVANIESLQAVLGRARERFGRIQGVIHAAGTLEEGVISSKTQDGVERVFTPKVHGTLLLEKLLADDPPDLFMVFASTSSVLAPPGQVDYVAANCFLNALAESRSSAPGRMVAVNWGVWNGVGMATGLAAGIRGEDPIAGADPERPAHPLFTQRFRSPEDSVAFEGTYSGRSHWILDEHRTQAGRAVVPGTAYVELVRAAVEEAARSERMEIRDLSFVSPLSVGDEEERTVRVVLRPEGDGYGFEVRSRAAANGSHAEEWGIHAQGSVRPGAPASEQRLPIKEILSRVDGGESARATGSGTRQESFLSFGPRWRSIDRVGFGDREAMAVLELPREYVSDLEAYKLHPALLDMATGFALPLIKGYEGTRAPFYVPVSYGRVRVHGPLTSRLYSHVRGDERNSADGEVALFDVRISDETGRVRVEVERLALKRVDAPSEFAAAREPNVSKEAPPLSPGERLFLKTYDAGIRPEEGMDVLDRILHGESPSRLVVSPVDLDVLLEQAAALAAPAVGREIKFSRPSLMSAYVEPRDPVERTLARFWEDLLGVERVGVQDDFFELGGHSLIAVRLFAKIRKEWDLEYPISVLFQAPTIARCAEVIRRDLGEESEDASPSGHPAESGRRSKHRFLVPMKSVAGSGNAPFFLVSGMFGNVLNLRHLAAHLGNEQPVFALQARGLLGDDRPHTSFPEMASDYLAEVRSIQPRGPYLLGGFSGGGITALEMAQQLKAAGEEVGLLVMLDTSPPEVPSPTRGERFRIQWQRLRRKGPAYLTEWAKNRIAWEAGRVRRLFRRPPPAETPAQFRSEEIRAGFCEALARYRTQAYDGRVVLFRPPLDESHPLGSGRTASSRRVLVDPHNFWTPYITGGIEVHVVPGDHDSMVLEPHVRVLATRLKERLVDAQVRTRSRRD